MEGSVDIKKARSIVKWQAQKIARENPAKLDNDCPWLRRDALSLLLSEYSRDAHFTLEEFQRFVRKCLCLNHVSLTDGEVWALYHEIEPDHDGQIDVNEMAEYLSTGKRRQHGLLQPEEIWDLQRRLNNAQVRWNRKYPTHEGGWKAFLKRYMEDDGCVDREEFYRIVREDLNVSKNEMPDFKLDGMFAFIDLDWDNNISMREMLEFVNAKPRTTEEQRHAYGRITKAQRMRDTGNLASQATAEQQYFFKAIGRNVPSAGRICASKSKGDRHDVCDFPAAGRGKQIIAQVKMSAKSQKMAKQQQSWKTDSRIDYYCQRLQSLGVNVLAAGEINEILANRSSSTHKGNRSAL